ncbi:hypothetical protein [Rubrivirga sp. IMCC43871]|uniref:hypothetical protein n=1 Tax=Rubrivirga sp. IMCC43871 TaxID=3391575 RepID=UPI00398FC52A
MSDRIAVRAGVGYLPPFANYLESSLAAGAVSVPLMVTLTPSGASGLEAGVGFVVQKPVDRAGVGDLVPTATVGYRRVTEAGDLFRFGITPFLIRGGSNPAVVPWVGVSFGAAM